MSKLLIAVKSCRRDFSLGAHDVIRNTWGRTAKMYGVDVRFFIGRDVDDKRSQVILKSDETELGCPDDYMSLPFKTRDICQWATGKVYDHILLCDNDTFLIPRLLKNTNYTRTDYLGYFTKGPDSLGTTFHYTDINPSGHVTDRAECYSWASGGVGYILSRAAFLLVADSYPSDWAEDLWVGQVLGPSIAKGELFAEYVDKEVYGFHYPFVRAYDPKSGWMEKMFRERQ